MSNYISYLIEKVCKKHEIEYKSKNLYKKSFMKDACKLGEVYIKLKEIMVELKEIEEKYELEGIGILLQDDIEKLNATDHSIIRIARELKNKEIQKRKE